MKTLLFNIPSFSGKIVSPTLKEPVEERISVFLKDRKKKVVSTFFTILIMVVCKAVIL